MKRRIDSIILSAGKSERMGRDKALLRINNKTHIVLILEKLLPFSECVYIVLGENLEAVKNEMIASNLDSEKIKFIYNQNHEQGMFSSVLKGFGAITGKYPVLLQMVDQPFLSVSLYRQLISALDEDNFVFQPYIKSNGKKLAGHPILFSAEFKDFLLSNSDKPTLRDVIHLVSQKRKFILVEDEEIMQNINTKNELNRIVNKG
jgi:CTP:molybdopterin cytidylyltransferase MocA